MREEKAESDCLLREDLAELSYSDSYTLSLDSLAASLLSCVEAGEEEADSPERNSQEEESVW